ncbi:maltokinase N-terminal cap-like domain-containing protein [Paeniglutamicibacter sp. R2-26]|uniref:maltokinase N-terminal cap-like domain-containing protein n=1 Tax=Paeniglutamicibacter sp. R2-26 TaxID=3144417 RepID=UPI003EE60CA9
MSVIFETTMAPTKRELMASWLPGQSWFAGNTAPSLRVVGGFRLDDPAGKVGLEMILVLDEAPEAPVLYHVPLSYRGEALPGAEGFLVGTSEHGVLGTRWIYDAAGDPVWQEQVRALAAGSVQAQHQSTSNTPEPAVTVGFGPSTGESRPVFPVVVRRPRAGAWGSAEARAWIGAPWPAGAGDVVTGAVIELL